MSGTPVINPALVPNISPGNLFTRFTTDTTLNVRWLCATDPVYYAVANRPIADTVLRQLILAKAVDNLELRLSHQANFPFLISCNVMAGSIPVPLPQSWIWDMHASMPAKWEYVRLAEIQRISGSNPSGSSAGEYTGTLRLIFTGQEHGATTEVALFYADYSIGSTFTYQFAQLNVATPGMFPSVIDPGEAETIAGYIIFLTLDQTNTAVQQFYTYLAPGTPTPTYEIADSEAAGISNTEDFFLSSMSHGTGVLVISAYNSIPSMESDFNTWLSSNCYPFRIDASRTSAHGITIPKALFREFNIVVPSPDEPTGDISKLNYPVWVSAIQRIDTLANELKFFFSTYTILDDGNPQEVQFASLNLERTFVPGQVVAIEPITNLLKEVSSVAANFLQGFGTGHVVLSSLWGGTSAGVSDFFDAFLPLTDVPAITTFSKPASILSSYALNRVPKYVPTAGQSGALLGSTARLGNPVHPSKDNRYVTEADQGMGDAIDFRTYPSFPDDLREDENIEPIGYTGSLAHRIVYLVVSTADQADDSTYYTEHILPRLRCLYGRDPIFGDMWYSGSDFRVYNGQAWVQI